MDVAFLHVLDVTEDSVCRRSTGFVAKNDSDGLTATFLDPTSSRAVAAISGELVELTCERTL